MKRLAFFFLLIVLSACSDARYKQTGYFKANDERIFTFNTTVKDELEIRRHGDNLMHSDGHTTVSLYFHSGAPDITKSASREAAYDEAKIQHPFAEVYILPDGKDSMMLYHN